MTNVENNNNSNNNNSSSKNDVLKCDLYHKEIISSR